MEWCVYVCVCACVCVREREMLADSKDTKIGFFLELKSYN